MHWALGMISSRAAELEWWSDDAEAASGTTRAKPRVRMKEDTMVPLFDLANHKRPRDTSFGVVETHCDVGSSGNNATEAFEVRALRDIPSGDPLHVNYGCPSNAQLLQRYGFVTLPNIEPDGSSNDILKVQLPSGNGREGGGINSVILELRMADDVRRPFPSWNRSILTEIYLCHACSCQEILRAETAGQVPYTYSALASGMDAVAQPLRSSSSNTSEAAGNGCVDSQDDFAAFEKAMESMEHGDDHDSDDEVLSAAPSMAAQMDEHDVVGDASFAFDEDSIGEAEMGVDAAMIAEEQRSRWTVTASALRSLSAELAHASARYVLSQRAAGHILQVAPAYCVADSDGRDTGNDEAILDRATADAAQWQL
jgi:hypothetical protein